MRGESPRDFDAASPASPPPWSCTGARVLIAEDSPVTREVVSAMFEVLGCSFHLVTDGRRAVEAAAGGLYAVILMDCLMPGMDGFEAAAETRQDVAGDPPLDRAVLAALAALGRPGATDLAAKVAGLYLLGAPASLATLRAAVAGGDARGVREAAHRLKSGSGNVGARPLAALLKELERLGREGDLAGADELLVRVESEYGRVRRALEPLIASHAAAAGAAAPGKGEE